MTTAPEWSFIDEAYAIELHDRLIARTGGAGGLRDQTMLLSALDRASNRASYGEPDAAELAACYLYGVARNHPFIDGNKRTATAVMLTFLDKHRLTLRASHDDLLTFVVAVAAGEMLEAAAAAWLRERL